MSNYLYGYSGTNPDPDGDNQLNHFRNWQTFWGPRLAPTGSFKLAGLAKQNNATLSSSSPTARTSSAVTSNWTPLGPFGGIDGYQGSSVGRINAIAFAPGYNGTTNQTMYCGGENSGLWKYDGSQWTSLNTDGQLAQLGIADIEIDPVLNGNNHFIYLATSDYNFYSGFNYGSAGIYSSLDNGLTWNPINTGLFDNFSYGIDNSVSKILIDPTSGSNVMYAATSDGIYKCSNKQSTSASWTKVYPVAGSSPASKYMSSLLFDPKDTTYQTLYACGFDVVKSTDGGAHWNSLTGPGTGLDFTGSPNLTVAPFGASNHISIANPSGYIDYIRDMNSVISADGRYLTVSLVTTVTNGPPYFWFSGIHNYIYRYDTQINSWTQKQQSDTIIPAYIYRLAFKLSPADTGRIFIGNQYLRGTTDGAQSWHQVYGDQHMDVRAIEFDPSDTTGNTLFVGCDGGVFKFAIDSSGLCPTGAVAVNNGLNVSTMYNLSSSPFDPYQIAASMQDDGNNYLKDSTWTHLDDNGGDGYQSFMDSKHEDIFYVTDGSFLKANVGTANNPDFSGAYDMRPSSLIHNYGSLPFVLNPLNPSSIYAGGDELFKTIYGNESNSATWTKISNFASHAPGNSSSIFRIALAPSDTQTIYLSDYYGTHVFKTTVGGDTSAGAWVDVTPATGNPTGYTTGYVIAGLAVSSTDPTHVWIGYSGYDATGVNKVQESKDGGNTWTVIPWVNNSSNPLPNIPVNCLVYEAGSNDGIYAATDIGVYYHNNAMTGWEPFMTGLPNVIVNWLEINYTANKIRAATFGRGAWESDLACPVNYDVTESITYAADTFVEAGNNLYSTADDAGYNVTYRAVNKVDLQSGFHASPGTNIIFHAFIHGCSSPGNSFRRADDVDSKNYTYGEEDEEHEMMNSTKNKKLTADQRIAIIPNPNGGIFNLRINDPSVDDAFYSVNVTDLSGRLVKTMDNVTDKNLKMDLTGLPAGFYFVKVNATNWQTIKKVIIQN